MSIRLAFAPSQPPPLLRTADDELQAPNLGSSRSKLPSQDRWLILPETSNFAEYARSLVTETADWPGKNGR